MLFVSKRNSLLLVEMDLVDHCTDRMEVLEDVMKMVFQITDAVASVKLSPKAQAAVAKVRAELDKKQLREEHSARQEVEQWRVIDG